MGIRTDREASLQLYFLWGMIDAAKYPLIKDSSNTGNNFRSCQPHEEEKEKKRASLSSAPVKILYWALKISRA
jgi:hypothetical protein